MLKFNLLGLLLLAILALANAAAPTKKQDSKGAAQIVNILAPKDVTTNDSNDSTNSGKSETSGTTFNNTTSANDNYDDDDDDDDDD